VHVTWSVIPAAGDFTPATTTTDVNGVASTAAQLGVVVGTHNPRRRPGCPDVVYHATALDPCTDAHAVHSGIPSPPRSRSPTATSRTPDGSTDFYQLHLPVGQQSIRISMHANFPAPPQAPGDSNDAWIDFWSLAGPLVAFDDDSVLGGDATDRAGTLSSTSSCPVAITSSARTRSISSPQAPTR